MLTSVIRLTILLCVATAALMADWKVYIDKKTSPITGLRSAHADLKAKGLGTATLVVGCNDGKSFFRIADQFRGFNVAPGQEAQVKLRPSTSSEYVEMRALATQTENGVAVLVLDELWPRLLPNLKADTVLLVEMPYQLKVQIATFQIAGLEGALAKMADAGCRP